MSGVFFQMAAVMTAACVLASGLFFLPRPGFQTAAALALYPLWRLRGKPFFMPVFLTVLFLLGVSAWRLDREAPLRSAADLAGRKVNLEGVVSDAPEIRRIGKRTRIQFVLSVREHLYFNGEMLKREKASGRVAVRLYSAARVPSRGDLVRVSGTLERPSPRRNPSGYDEARRFSEAGLCAVLKGAGLKALTVLEPAPPRFLSLARLDAFRFELGRRIERLWAPKEAGYFKALMIGERSEITPEEREAFIRTSTAHILSISGLHFTLIAGTFFLIMTALGVRAEPAAFLSLFFLAAYVFIAGAGIPVIRAGLMAALVMGAILLGRESQALSAFSFVYASFLLFDTRVLSSVSFQLSFLSVFVLIVFCRAGTENKPVFWGSEGVRAGLAVAAGTFPVTASVFHGFSLSAIPANLLAVPLFNAGLLLAFPAVFLESIPWLAEVFSRGAAFFLRLALSAVSLFSRIPGSYAEVADPPLWKTGAYVLFGMAAIVERLSRAEVPRFWRRVIYSGLLLSGLSFFLPTVKPWTPSLTLLESRAHPLAVVSFAPGREWLFFNPVGRFEREEPWVLAPFLKGRGIRRFEGALMLGSPRERFVSGGSSRAGGIPVDALFSGEAGAAPDHAGKLPAGACLRLGKEGGGVQVLGFASGKPLILLTVGGADFLVLPVLNAESQSVLLRLQEWINGPEVLILPRLPRSAAAVLPAVLEAVDPSLVVTSDASLWPETLETKRVLDQKELGALTFERKESQLWVSSQIPSPRRS